MIKIFKNKIHINKNAPVPFCWKVFAKLFVSGFLLIIVMICISCQPDNSAVEQIEEAPAVIYLQVKGEEQMNSMTRIVNEDAINDLHILIYDKNGELIGQQYDTYTIGSTMVIKTHSAVGCTIYAIANTNNANLFNNYDIHLETYLKKLTCSILAWNELTNSSYLPMMNSKNDIKIQAGTQNSLTMTVSRLVAKITLDINAKAGSGIVITGYQICNLPKTSYYLPYTTDATNNTWLNSENISTGSVSSVSTSFYMFENRKGTITTIDRQQDKTSKNAPANATYIVINGTLQNTTIRFEVYLGENNTKDFNIKRNSKYTYTITLNATGKADARVTIDTPDVINLCSNGWANCYLASTDNQWYKFDGTIRGNGQTQDYAAEQYSGLSLMPSTIKGAINAVTIPAANIEDAIVVWETTKGLIDWVIWDVNTGYVKFKTSNIKGNAVIAVRDINKKILWSWHIWRTNNVNLTELNSTHSISIQTNTLRSWHTSTQEKRNIKIMDRNLGSAFDGSIDFMDCIGSNGLHYQFGRKDPFPAGTIYNTDPKKLYGDVTLYGYGSGNTETSFTIFDRKESSQVILDAKATIDYTIQHPEVFICGNVNSYNWISNATTNSSDWKISNCLWGDNNNSASPNSMDPIPWDGSKTIYDPCPVGWRMTPSDAWTGIGRESMSSWNGVGVGDIYISDGWNLGFKFYSNNIPSNSIFCPPLGYRDWEIGYLCNSGSYGYYWYSSHSGQADSQKSEIKTNFFQFYKDGIYMCQSTCRAYGFSVRCVKE